MRKRIDREKLTQMKQKVTRPGNCNALVVPLVNPGIWKGVNKWQRGNDARMQSSQNLLVKGLSCTVAAKDKLMQCSESAESHRILQEANAQLSSAIALLGNAFLELSYVTRDLMKSGIDRRFHALCTPSIPVTNYLFGDKIQESVKEISELPRVSKSVQHYHPCDCTGSQPRHKPVPGRRGLNWRATSAPPKGKQENRRQPFYKPSRGRPSH